MKKHVNWLIMTKSSILIKLLFSGLLAFINAVCTQVVIAHACFGWSNNQHVQWMLYFIISFFASFLFIEIVDLLFKHQSGTQDSRSNKIIQNQHLTLPIALFICWLPYLLIYWPGLVNYDTINQVLDYFDGVASFPFGFVEGQEEVVALFNAHHPVFVTLIFGTFIKIGALIGKPALGLSLYILIQMILASIILSESIIRIEAMGSIKNTFLKKAIILFFAFCPIIPYYMCNMLKNTLHSTLVIAFTVLYLHITLTDHILSTREKIFWILLAILLCLTQNTGVYFVILTSLFIVFKIKENRYTILAGMIISAIIMFILLPKVIYPAFNIYEGGKQEILGTLFQQTARYVKDYEDDISDEDIAIISDLIDYNSLVNEYNPDTTDDIKATYNMHASKDSINRYLLLWLRQGIKHPDSYFRATLTICGQFFATGYDVGIFDHIPSDDGIWAEINHTVPENTRMSITAIYEWVKKFPGISMIFQHALYTLWIPVYCLYYSIINKRKRIVFIVPFIVNMLLLVASPMVYSRYALPMIFTSPLLLYSCSVTLSNKQNCSEH